MRISELKDASGKVLRNAKVLHHNGTRNLISYETCVLCIKSVLGDELMYADNDWWLHSGNVSATTLKQIKAFTGLNKAELTKAINNGQIRLDNLNGE